MEQICTSDCPRAFGIGEISAQSRKVVAKDIPDRALCDVLGAVGRVIQDSHTAVVEVFNHKRRLTLCNAIGELHAGNVAGAVAGD
ncbi:MAG TPA: hypothetical protein VN860_07700 [Candidatus Acidoferrales bacterium]|nr:hypothetical protein [Candidatus Acidoferrales bacterium]